MARKFISVSIVCVVYFKISGILANKDNDLKLMPSREVIARLYNPQVVWATYPTAIESCRIKLHNKWYKCDPPDSEEKYSNKICQQPIDPILSWTTNFETGTCGFILKRVRDKWNGHITFEIMQNNISHSNKMRFIVAREPILFFNVIPMSSFEDAEIKAECFVERARPAANISWFLDGDNIKDGLEHPIVAHDPDTDLYAIKQSLRLKLDLQLLGRELTCQVNYIYPDKSGNVSSRYYNESKILDFKFPPRPMYGESTNIIIHNITVGSRARLNVSLCAKPDVDTATWSVDGKRVTPFSEDPLVEISTIDMGPKICCCNNFVLLVNMTEKLMRSNYILTVWNFFGMSEFNIYIGVDKSVVTETTTQTSGTSPTEKYPQNINTIIINTSQNSERELVDRRNLVSLEGTSPLAVAAYVIIPLLLIIPGLGSIYYFYEKRNCTGHPQNNSASSPDEAVYAYVPIETVSFYSARTLITSNRKVPSHVSFVPTVPTREPHTSDYDYAIIH